MASFKKRRDIDGLCEAARYGRLEDVKQYLQYGVDVNGKDWLGNTPLNAALTRGHSQIVQFLVFNGARYDINGLVNAAGGGRLEDVKMHLQNGVDVNEKDRDGNTPLNAALICGHSQIVQILVSKGARGDINGFVDAASDGRLEDVKIHLQNGVDVNEKNKVGDTALNVALRNRHSQIVQILVSKGARYDIDGLAEAVTDGRLEDVKLHLQNGVDVNGKNRYDSTPLNVALRRGHSQIVQLLVSKGARYDIECLCWSVRGNQLKIVKKCLEDGVDVNERDKDDNTPLNIALREDHSQVVELLVSKGARCNIECLCWSVRDYQLKIVKKCLEDGVDVNGRDRYGDTPLNEALRMGYPQVIQFLISKGARDDYKTKIVKNAFTKYEKNKRNTITALQKCITKAKKQKGKVKITFIKLLFTGSGKAGKTSFSNLLMKNKFINFHHSTKIIQAKHAVSVKKAFIVGSDRSNDQSIVWLEINDDSQMSHLRQILLSLDISSSQKLKDHKMSTPSTVPQPKNSSQAAIQSNSVQQTSVKKEYVTHENTPLLQKVTGLFQQGPVKSNKLSSFNTLVENSIESNILKYDINYHGEVLNIITLLDTGGQPEYIHLLPTVNINPMVNFVIHDLSKNLEDQVLVEYSENGKPVFEPYHLRYSNFDMIKFLMSSINDSLERTSSQVPQLVTNPGKKNTSYLCCVGTHVDKTSRNIIQNIGCQLTALVEKLDCKAAIWQNEDYGVLFPVDNTTAGDESKEDPTANFIRSKINQLAKDKDTYELPITWMLLKLEIRKECSNRGKPYLSFSECWSIAFESNLISNIEEVRSALIYHHLLGVLLYYPDVPGLCEYVIVDHQWLFDKISNIVCFTFKQSSNIVATNSLKYNGILTNELIQELNWNEELREDYFITLLVEMKIIAPIKRENDNEDDYFIPYILPTYTIQPQSDDILSQYGCLQGEPLLIQFVSNLLPRGFFCCLVVQMLQQLPKDIGCLFTQRDTYHTYSNLITLRLHSAYCLSLMDKLSYLEVQIRHPKKDYHLKYPVHLKAQELLANALQVVCEQLTYNHGRLQYGFLCQCKEYDYEHIAVLRSLAPPFDYALCRQGGIIPTELGSGHTVWLAEITDQVSSIMDDASSNLSGQQSIECKLFTDYHSKLVHTLPASDLSHYFVSDKIISLEDHERIIKSAIQQDASKLLLERVLLQLQKGNISVFSKMLLIMNHYGVNTAKTMSVEIQSKLPTVMFGKESSFSTEEAVAAAEAIAQPTNDNSAEYEVYIRYYSQIVNSLPVETLSPHFVSHKIISPAEQLEISSVPSPIKAAGLLLSKISCALEAGITETFYKFLNITEKYGSIDSKTLTTAIRKRLMEIKSIKDKDTDSEDDVLKDDDPPDTTIGEGPKTIT